MHSVPSSAKYDFWIKNNVNVLLIGKHGIGKTESVKEKFNEHFGTRWMYFSASTMDPWVDFVGVPKEKVDPDTGKSYLELIQPAALANDEVEAIMIDEYNRAPAKVRNAIMELVQFKSINGKRFKNLKIVWAAINPDDDDSYDVEKLDPAQKDRFPVHVYYPYVVNREYFINKYGDEGETACVWWEKQDDELKADISPRRLSYAMDMFSIGGDLTDVLPFNTNIEELVTQLTNGAYMEGLKKLLALKDDEKTKQAFNSENFYFGTMQYILDNTDYLSYFVPKWPKERLVAAFLKYEKVRRHFDEHEDYRAYQSVFDPIINSNTIEQKSVLSLLNRWKERTVSINSISDAEFIDMTADNRRNIELLSNPDKQRDVINKFGSILNGSIVLGETFYHKMLGVSCELLTRVEDTLKEFVISNIKAIKQIMIKQGFSNINTIVNDKLPGLRRAKTDKYFEEVRSQLIKEDILNANHQS